MSLNFLLNPTFAAAAFAIYAQLLLAGARKIKRVHIANCWRFVAHNNAKRFWDVVFTILGVAGFLITITRFFAYEDCKGLFLSNQSPIKQCKPGALLWGRTVHRIFEYAPLILCLTGGFLIVRLLVLAYSRHLSRGRRNELLIYAALCILSGLTIYMMLHSPPDSYDCCAGPIMY